MTGSVWNPMAQQYEPKPLSLADFLLQRIDHERTWYAHRGGVCSCPMNSPVWSSNNHRPGCPKRALAECEAKRWLVETFRPINRVDYNDPEILRRLALPYADHPDYDEAWKP